MQNKIIEKLLIKDQIYNKNIQVISKVTGGMSNTNYLLKDGDKDYIYRTPEAGSNQCSNRNKEQIYSVEFFKRNISPELLFFDQVSGRKLNKYIEGQSLNNKELTNEDILKVSELLKTIQGIPLLDKEIVNSTTCFNKFEALINFGLISKESISTYNECKDLLVKLESKHSDLLKPVTCHGDFQRSNIIVTPNKEYYVIDLEYCGVYNQYYDIAAFGNNNLEDSYSLLKVFKPNYDQVDVDMVNLNRAFQSLQWFLVANYKHNLGLSKVLNLDFITISNHYLQLAYSLLREIN